MPRSAGLHRDGVEGGILDRCHAGVRCVVGVAEEALVDVPAPAEAGPRLAVRRGCNPRPYARERPPARRSPREARDGLGSFEVAARELGSRERVNGFTLPRPYFHRKRLSHSSQAGTARSLANWARTNSWYGRPRSRSVARHHL